MSALLDRAVATVLDSGMLVAVAMTAIAGVLRGYSGFGTAILLAPIYALLWGPRAGVPVMLLMELVTSAQLLPRSIRTADHRVVLPMGLTACIATPVGAWVLLTADQEILRRSIGAMVLGFGLLLMSGWRYHGARPGPLNIAIGVVSGLMKGSTGMAGPPVILYLLAGQEAARQHRDNLILYFAMIGIVAVIPPILGGIVDEATLVRAAVLLPVLYLCVRIGVRLFGVVSDRWYRRIAFLLLVATGLTALLV